MSKQPDPSRQILPQMRRALIKPRSLSREVTITVLISAESDVFMHDSVARSGELIEKMCLRGF